MKNNMKTTQLESTKHINNLKVKAIRNGGYKKFSSKITEACRIHLELFGVDLTPKQLV